MYTKVGKERKCKINDGLKTVLIYPYVKVVSLPIGKELMSKNEKKKATEIH